MIEIRRAVRERAGDGGAYISDGAGTWMVVSWRVSFNTLKHIKLSQNGFLHQESSRWPRRRRHCFRTVHWSRHQQRQSFSDRRIRGFQA